MAYQTVSKLGAGSHLYFEDPAVPGVYTLLSNALSIGQVGEQGEFVEDTPISSTVKTFLRGLTTPPTKQITFNHIPGNADYAAFLSVWDDPSVEKINMRVDYTSNDRGAFALVPNGRMMDEPSGAAQLQQICYAQQSGATIWTEI